MRDSQDVGISASHAPGRTAWKTLLGHTGASIVTSGYHIKVSRLSLVSERVQAGLGTSFTFHETVVIAGSTQTPQLRLGLVPNFCHCLPSRCRTTTSLAMQMLRRATKLSSMATIRKEQHTPRSPLCMALLQLVQLLDVAETLTAD